MIDEGPYCWKEPGSREVEPCSVCCTEPQVRSQEFALYGDASRFSLDGILCLWPAE